MTGFLDIAGGGPGARVGSKAMGRKPRSSPSSVSSEALEGLLSPYVLAGKVGPSIVRAVSRCQLVSATSRSCTHLCAPRPTGVTRLAASLLAADLCEMPPAALSVTLHLECQSRSRRVGSRVQERKHSAAQHRAAETVAPSLRPAQSQMRLQSLAWVSPWLSSSAWPSNSHGSSCKRCPATSAHTAGFQSSSCSSGT